MAKIKPFKGIRPLVDVAYKVAALPYDVLSTEEAKILVEKNYDSFLSVTKPETTLCEFVVPTESQIYNQAKSNFDYMFRTKMFFQDQLDCFYIYLQVMDDRYQYGIVGCASIDDYNNNIIKKHELTRHDKEKDRIQHIDVTNLNTGPVFLTYPDVPGIDEIVKKAILKMPEYDFIADDNIQHTVWKIEQQPRIDKLIELFAKVPYIYIADGHHRAAAAASVGKKRREANPNHTGKEEYNYFLAVLFPATQLKIFDYNRVVKDLNRLKPDKFLNKVGNYFFIEDKGNTQYRPDKPHNLGMYLNKKWYALTAKPDTYNENDPIETLDVTILSNNILMPLLGIKDLRSDNRIDFVGGIRGLQELEKRVDSGEMQVAFALHPVTIEQLIKIADTNNIMPPKTTWFEPKLRSGLIVHSLIDDLYTVASD